MDRKLKQLTATAYHEAGHTAATIEVNLRVKEVSIIPNKERNSLGHCSGPKAPRWLLDADHDVSLRVRDRLERMIIVLLAGPIAEAQWTGRRNHVGASGDVKKAVDLMSHLAGGKEADAYLAWLYIRAENIIASDATWGVVQAIAEALLAQRRITGKEARRLYDEGARLVLDEQEANLETP